MKDDSTEILLQSFLWEDIVSKFSMGRDVHSSLQLWTGLDLHIEPTISDVPFPAF